MNLKQLIEELERRVSELESGRIKLDHERIVYVPYQVPTGQPNWTTPNYPPNYPWIPPYHVTCGVGGPTARLVPPSDWYEAS